MGQHGSCDLGGDERPQPWTIWRKAVAGGCALMAAVLVAGCNSQQTRETFRLPHNDPSLDVNIESVNLTLHGVDPVVIHGSLYVKTLRDPTALEVYAVLARWDRIHKDWITEDTQTYKKVSLPEPGHDGTLKPILEAYCRPHTKWRISFTSISISSTGKHERIYFYWPGKPNNRNWLTASIHPVNRGGKGFSYGIYVGNCQS